MRALITAAVAWAGRDVHQRERLVEMLRGAAQDARSRARMHDRVIRDGHSIGIHQPNRDAAITVAEVYEAAVAVLEIAASPETVTVLHNVAEDMGRHAEDGALGAIYAARAYIDGLIEEAEREAEALRAGRSHDGGSTE